jgi:hypothetical protein
VRWGLGGLGGCSLKEELVPLMGTGIMGRSAGGLYLMGVEKLGATLGLTGAECEA